MDHLCDPKNVEPNIKFIRHKIKNLDILLKKKKFKG